MGMESKFKAREKTKTEYYKKSNTVKMRAYEHTRIGPDAAILKIDHVRCIALSRARERARLAPEWTYLTQEKRDAADEKLRLAMEEKYDRKKAVALELWSRAKPEGSDSGLDPEDEGYEDDHRNDHEEEDKSDPEFDGYVEELNPLNKRDLDGKLIISKEFEEDFAAIILRRAADMERAMRPIRRFGSYDEAPWEGFEEHSGYDQDVSEVAEAESKRIYTEK